MELIELPEAFWVSRLDSDADLPTPRPSSLYSISQTADEISIVGPEGIEGARTEGPWRAFRVAGVLDFSLIGVLHALVEPLKHEGISVFVQSTFDTDYILVRQEKAEAAVSAWTSAGHTVSASS